MATRVLNGGYHEVWSELAPVTGVVTIQTGIPVVNRDPAELSRMEAWLIVTAGAGLASSPTMSINPATGLLDVSFAVNGGTITYTIDIHYHQPQGVDPSYAGLGLVLGAGGGGGGGALLLDHLNAPVPPAPPGPTYREVFVGVMDATNTVPQHTQTEANHPVMPHVDTGTGVVAFNAPNVPNEALFNPQVYLTKTITATSMPIVGTGHRGLWAVVEMNPPADSTVRAWGVNASAEITPGNTRNFAAPYGGDLIGVEGAGRHAGTGTVGLAIGSSGYVMCSDTGTIDQAVALYARSPRVDGPPGSVGRIVRCEGLRVHFEVHAVGAVVDFQYGFIVEDLCGPCGIGYENPVAKLAVNGGIHAGGESDPGAGRIQGAFVSSDGTLGVTGSNSALTTKDGIVVALGGGGGATFFLQQIALVDAANGNDATGAFGTLLAFKTIQAAVNAVPAYTDPAGQRRWWGIIVAPGTYDEVLDVDCTRRKIAILGFGPFNLGLFNGSAWGPTNNRDITVRQTAGNVDGQRHSFMLGSMLPQGEAITTHPAYMGVPRISGKIIIDDTAIPGGTTADMYLECEVFDQAGTGNCIDGTAKAGILNTYLHRCRTRMAFSAPSMRLQKAERCRFDGAAFATYSRLQDSFFGGSIFVTSVPPPDVEPYGFVGCSFAAGITFTGPAASLVLDSNSNYWFKTRGCLLGGAASKVITGDLTP